jgi:hypothetical protein
MSFKRTNFKVKLTGRSGLVYREGDHVMMVDSEMLLGSDCDFVIYTKPIDHWEPPYDHEPVSEADKRQIRLNIAASLCTAKIDWQEPNR